jgi:Mrp family chromosome partitioning ATPase
MADVPANANSDCVGPSSEQAGKAAGCVGCPNQSMCASGAARQVDPAIALINERLKSVKHTILVLSGKGGVGKSSTSAQLAWALAATGKEVGILDIDLCGPSIPTMMGLVGEQVHKSGSGWSPVYAEDNLAVMSIGFMLPDADAPVIWRGPRKNGLIKQFLTDVDWGELDFLIIDTPPGTSDEHISMAQYLNGADIDGAVVVTTPQEVAMSDVRKELKFCEKTRIPVLGLVENMSHAEVPVLALRFADAATRLDRTAEAVQLLKERCPELLEMIVTTDVFAAHGAGVKGMAEKFKVPYLGRVPLDPQLVKACDAGEAVPASCPAGIALRGIVARIVEAVTTAPAAGASAASSSAAPQ